MKIRTLEKDSGRERYLHQADLVRWLLKQAQYWDPEHHQVLVSVAQCIGDVGEEDP